jgi:hypothetical protein
MKSTRPTFEEHVGERFPDCNFPVDGILVVDDVERLVAADVSKASTSPNRLVVMETE